MDKRAVFAVFCSTLFRCVAIYQTGGTSFDFLLDTLYNTKKSAAP